MKTIIIYETDDSIEIIGEADTVEAAKEKAEEFCEKQIKEMAESIAYDCNTHPERQYEDMLGEGFGFADDWGMRREVLCRPIILSTDELYYDEPGEIILLPLL